MSGTDRGRRGLGRGLGSLIPTGPPPTPAAPARADDPRPRGSDEASYGEGGDVRGDAGSGPAGSGEPQPTVAGQGDGLAPVEGATFAELPIGSIRPNAHQPRQVFEEEALAELVHSIREVGLLQPIVVRPIEGGGEGGAAGAGAGEAEGGGLPRYELVMGERRWRASQEAGLTRIPAIVRVTEDTDMLRDALLENLHRAQLNPLEEASAYAQLLEDFGCTHEELAGRIGRSRPQISNTIRLLRLSPAVQRRVAAGVLSAGHARSLLAVDDAEVQDRLAQRVVAEGISVRGLEEIVAVGDLPGGEGAGRRSPRNKPFAPGLVELSDRLSDRLETRVKIDLGKSKGKVVVEFASLDDLRRIVDIMDPRNRNDRPV